jgi:copper resistance protein B
MGHCTMPPQSAPENADPPVAPPPPEAIRGPAHAADEIFDPAAMARSRAALAQEHGGLAVSKLLVDRLELGIGRGRETYAWEAQFWHGGDIDKFWLKSEGDGEFGGAFHGVEVQALWSRAIDPWFDLQLGIRQDLGSGPDRTHLVAGVQGLAPYWFEVEGALFLSNRGDLTARAEAEYDLRLTQTLILQPRGEIDFSLQDVPELRLGSGLTTAEFGARLRYEFFPRSGPAMVAPYVGVQYQRAFGDTARFRRAADEQVGGWSVLFGMKTWF